MPLAGITGVSIEQVVAAPYATRQLADFGARVIKVERPDAGDFARSYDEMVHGGSSYFVWLNRSKESITLDIKSLEGRLVLDRLLAVADVFVQNLGTGAAARLRLDEKTLQRHHPGPIVCDASGYGQQGPWADRKAYHLLVQSEAGLLSLTGPEGTPSRVGISIADIAAGMYAFAGILISLHPRATARLAAGVQVALFEALAEWMGAPALYTQYGGEQPLRVGAEHATIAPYGPYETADGATVMVAAQSQGEWRAFCETVLREPRAGGRSPVRTQLGAGRQPGRRPERRDRAVVRPAGRRDGYPPLGRGGPRERPAAVGVRVSRTPVVAGQEPLAGRRHPRRRRGDAATAGRRSWRGAADGPRAGAGRAHRGNPRRAGLRRGVDSAVASW